MFLFFHDFLFCSSHNFLIIVDNKKKLHCDFFCLWCLANKCYIVLHLVRPYRFYSLFLKKKFIYSLCYCGFSFSIQLHQFFCQWLSNTMLWQLHVLLIYYHFIAKLVASIWSTTFLIAFQPNSIVATNWKIYIYVCFHQHWLACNISLFHAKLSHCVKPRLVMWFSIFLVTKYDECWL